MKKYSLALVVAMATIVLNGCGGSDGDETYFYDEGASQSIESLYLSSLQEGFVLEGHNESDEAVTLRYCGTRYDYYRGTKHWYGHFGIKEERINMFDETSTGGSYRIDTYNGVLEVNVAYPIKFQKDEIIIDRIVEDVSCEGEYALYRRFKIIGGEMQ